ncbi:UNVERIFIED_CONTAM: hypothetical protein PYX00_000454 [Menopon gallinae]
MNCTEVLLRIARNILSDPDNPKYRSISLSSNVVTNKLLPASGAMQCLFEMGFQEGSNNLVLPQGLSLDGIRYIHDELLKRREQKKRQSESAPQHLKSVPETLVQRNTNAVTKEVTLYLQQFNNEFLQKFASEINFVWRCESIPLQLKAVKLLPLMDLKKNVENIIKNIKLAIKKKEIEDQVIDCQELLLLELSKWFKHSFFKWVNEPECPRCGCKETKFITKRLSMENGVHRVEVYECTTCNETVLFPRYNDAEKLLESRRGRCGEWARCFFLFCRALGWDTRYVIDQTDHVWVEVYSLVQRKWIHCDPCETVVDSPLIYEQGWKKKLSYIIAFSKDEIQDVTWRYTCNFSEVLKNRKECSEPLLVDVICTIRTILLRFASSARKQFVTKRAVLELVDLSVQKSPTEAEKQGRTSGSLAWRLARGETSVDFQPFVWKPEKEDKDNLKFVLSYCTSADEYYLENSKKVVKGWRKGLYKVNSVFRKEEQDWKMVYLAREEGCDKGTLTWRFETDDGLTVNDVTIRIKTQTYEKGKVLCKLCNESACVFIPEGESFSTKDFSGSKHLELSVEFSGGGGSDWQHAQLLRQPLSELDKTFQITITYTPSEN